jgi:hypothetical protein
MGLLEPSTDESEDGTQQLDFERDEMVSGAAEMHLRPNLPTPYVPPSDEVERKICAVWQDMLGIGKVGVLDNFFDLGGHSLLAVRVMSFVNQSLQSEIPVAKLYEGLTVRFLAEACQREQRGGQDVEVATDEDQGQRRQERVKRQREHQRKRRAATGR